MIPDSRVIPANILTYKAFPNVGIMESWNNEDVSTVPILKTHLPLIL